MKKILFIIILFSITTNIFAQHNENLADVMKTAVNLSDEGKFKESNEKLLYLVQNNYLKDLAYFNISVNYFKLRDYAKAQKYSQIVVDMNSEYTLQATVILGKCFNINKNYTQERKVYDQTINKYPNEYLPYYLKAISFVDDKKNALAYPEFINAIKRYNFGPELHFDLAQTLFNDQLYMHSFLAYCFYLMTEPKSTRAIIAINKITDIMNITDADRIIAQKTAPGNKNTNEDEALISALLFVNSINKIKKDENQVLPNLDIFVKNLKSILKDISESITQRDGFYEKLYIDFFDNLLKDNKIDEYLYFTLNYHYPDINENIEGITKTRILQFSEWLQNYFENHNLE